MHACHSCGSARDNRRPRKSLFVCAMINVLANLRSLTSYKRLREKAKNCAKRTAEKNAVYDMEIYEASTMQGLGRDKVEDIPSLIKNKE